MVTSTLLGTGTGFLATLDMTKSWLEDDAQHLAAVTGRACGFIGHHTLRGGDNSGAQTASYLRQVVLALKDAQARPTYPLDSLDDGGTLIVFELDSENRLAALFFRRKICDITFIFQYPRNRDLKLGGRHRHMGLPCRLRVTDACQHIRNGIRHAHYRAT